MPLNPFVRFFLVMTLCVSLPVIAWAGPYAPEAGEPGTTAVSKDDPAFVAWATGWTGLLYGTNVNSTWKTPELALGPAQGTSYDILCLGRGGQVTMTFSPPIKNGAGWDFAVFENSFSPFFLELAFVEVSSNGMDFIRFENASLTPDPVGGVGALDPTDITGLAGKYKQGYGAPFDLQDLATHPLVLEGKVDLSSIGFVRLIDIVGSGGQADSAGRPIYDPYPTTSSAGFDLDAIGMRYAGVSGGDTQANPPEKPQALSPENAAQDVGLAPVLQTRAFVDPDPGDTHLLTLWQVAKDPGFGNDDLVFSHLSKEYFTSLALPGLILEPETQYWWRAKFYDGAAHASQWSDGSSFIVRADPDDQDGNSVPDSQQIQKDWDGDGLPDADIVSIKAKNAFGNEVIIGLEKGENVAEIQAFQALNLKNADPDNAPENLSTGLVEFRLGLDTPTKACTVVILLDEAAPPDAKWYKYDTLEGWREYEGAEFSADGSRVTLHLEDGSRAWGDTDGLANGIVIDPGGASYPEAVIVPESGEAGFPGSGSGCFMESLGWRGK